MTTPVLTGGCACGAVRYESSALPSFAFHCQCRQCQRASGTGHASTFVVPTDALTLTGELKFFDQPADSGNTLSRGFCPNCGSQVMSRSSGYPENRFIQAASLDDPSLFEPSTVVCQDSAQPWDYIDPNLRSPDTG